MQNVFSIHSSLGWIESNVWRVSRVDLSAAIINDLQCASQYFVHESFRWFWCRFLMQCIHLIYIFSIWNFPFLQSSPRTLSSSASWSGVKMIDLRSRGSLVRSQLHNSSDVWSFNRVEWDLKLFKIPFRTLFILHSYLIYEHYTWLLLMNNFFYYNFTWEFSLSRLES